VRDNSGALGDDVPTMASALHGAGYRTAAFVSSVVLAERTGLARGFDVYRDPGSTASLPRRFRRPGSETTDEALEWIDRNSSAPFFVWIHLYDAHAPIDLPEPLRAMYEADPYEGALAFMDSQLARVAARLDERGVADTTAIIVAADHGEALGDHGEQGHGIFVYQSVVHVPLVVCWPGVRPGRVASPVELTDVMPTVLAIEGVPAGRVDGHAIAPFVRSRYAPARDVYTESMYPLRFGWSDLRSLRSGDLKVIDAPRPELYDLAIDPAEQHNLIGERAPEARALLDRLHALPGGRGDNALATAATETARALQSLGYVSAPARAGRQALPDPKDMITEYNLIELRRPGRTAGQDK
jgi:arylsulfatase A-like enzyme